MPTASVSTGQVSAPAPADGDAPSLGKRRSMNERFQRINPNKVSAHLIRDNRYETKVCFFLIQKSLTHTRDLCHLNSRFILSRIRSNVSLIKCIFRLHRRMTMALKHMLISSSLGALAFAKKKIRKKEEVTRVEPSL